MCLSVFLVHMFLCHLCVWCLERSEVGITFHIAGNGHSSLVGVLISVGAEQIDGIVHLSLMSGLVAKGVTCLGVIKLN